MNGRKFLPLVVAAAGLLAYQNSFNGPFIFDDEPSILNNQTIRHLWPIGQTLSPPHGGGLTVEGRPLINFSLAVNYALGGYRVWGYHVLNLTVHILAGLALFGIVRRTLRAPTLVSRFGAAADVLALATAVLWTVHPLQTEAVTYVIQRAESIMGLFYLLTLYCFIRGTGSRQPSSWYGLCLTACALGMASKEVMATAPVMVLLYDRAFLSASFREAWQRRWPLYLALASTWFLLGYLLVFTGSLDNALTNAKAYGVSRWAYFLAEPGVVLHYLQLAVWPHSLCFDYHGWPTAMTWTSILPPAVVIVMLLGATGYAWRTNSALGFVGAWFFLILAPSSSIIPLDSPAYEHRMYVPLAAVLSLVAVGLYSLMGRRSLPVFVAVAIGLGFLTWRRNEDYRTELAIWADTVAKFPQNPRARSGLGYALKRVGRVQEAIHQYEQALQIKPGYANAHNNLGIALCDVGRVTEAIGHYEQAVLLRPNWAEAHCNLAGALDEVGRVQEAIGQYDWALRLKPDYAEAHNNLGNALHEEGKTAEALFHYEQALRIRPDYAKAHDNLGTVLCNMGKVTEAIGHYQQALRITPDAVEVHNNLGNALREAGRPMEAIEHYQHALRINPDYATAHNNLGSALQELGKRPEAIEQYERALQIKPDYAMAHYNLAMALEQSGQVQEAIAHYEQALRLQPDLVDARNRLAKLRSAR